MLGIGAHMSVAGGVSKAVDRAVRCIGEALHFSTKNASRWKTRRSTPPRSGDLRGAFDEAGIAPVVSHASYLINLATTVPELRAM